MISLKRNDELKGFDVMRTTQRLIYVDSNTGEVLGVEDKRDIFVQTEEQREAARHWVKKDGTKRIKPIGHFFQMILYLNKYYNVLCWNPGEDDYNLIKR